jgi:hypothetical protein
MKTAWCNYLLEPTPKLDENKIQKTIHNEH